MRISSRKNKALFDEKMGASGRDIGTAWFSRRG